MLRWRMLRQGAHQVKRPSSSGARARPTSTSPSPMICSSSARSSRQLADGAGLALLRMNVHIGARDVQVAADDQRPAVGSRCRAA